MRHAASRAVLAFLCVAASTVQALAATYDVGPGYSLATPSAVPWESLQPGDTVRIHWRTDPYRDKWVVTRAGTAVAPIVIRGVPGPGGELPVIDGSSAVTRLALDTWGESRFVIKIGGSSIPADVMPAYITIEGLDVRGAHTPSTFVDDAGATQSYVANAAAIWIEKGEHITIRGNRLHDSGNGLFVSSSDPNVSRDILIDGNAIFDNGNVGSIYEHNTYTEALGITYQFNYFGALKAGAGGNNLKDRSAGLVVRYNWIEGGNRQLDLVETDSATIQASPSYRQTFVYGNVLVETVGAGNRQIAHYGGDNGTTSTYRKGTLYFYQNTMVSYRTDRTTLFRLSTNEERADVRNNVFYVTAAGSTLSLLDETGILSLTHNWFKPGRVSTFGTLTGTINDDGSSVVGASPGFRDEAAQDLRLAAGSANVNAGAPLAAVVLPEPGVGFEYVKHQGSKVRSNDGVVDVGAFELEDGQPPPPPPDLVVTTSSLPVATVGSFYSASLSASGGIEPYIWSLASGSLPGGLSLSATGAITGTPTRTGSFSFTAQVMDAQAPADVVTRALTLGVARRRKSASRSEPADLAAQVTAPAALPPGVLVWRPPTTGPAPLIVFSHSYKGCNTQSLFLTKGLAAAGYLVVAPNHADALCGSRVPPAESFGDPQNWTDQAYRDRYVDITQLIATLRADPVSWPIDWSKVGLVGYSLGGYTVLGMGGAWPSWKTAGITAIVALSPYCEPFLFNGNLGGIGIPVMYQGGTMDAGNTTAMKSRGGCFAQNSSPAIYVELQGAGHLAWTNAKSQFQPVIIHYTQAFLDTNVRRVPAPNPAVKIAGVSDLRVK